MERVRLTMREMHALVTRLHDLRWQLDKPTVTARLCRSEARPRATCQLQQATARLIHTTDAGHL